MTDRETAQEGVRALLRLSVEDPSRGGLRTRSLTDSWAWCDSREKAGNREEPIRLFGERRVGFRATLHRLHGSGGDEVLHGEPRFK